MSRASKSTNPLVSVTLKSLLDLAGPSAGLSLQQNVKRAAQSGGYLSRFKGRGMEFDEARPYQPGDDVRSIDWRVTARTGRTYTKTFREERERPVFISVDYRAPMAFATRGVFKSVQAAHLAALLSWAAKDQGDRIGGQIFSDHGCLEMKPHHGKHAVLRFLNALVKPAYTVDAATDLAQALNRLVQHVRPGSLVYIISDFRGMNAVVENHLARLARHCDVVMLKVFDPLECELPDRGRYRFSNEQREVLIDAADKQRLRHYHQRFLEQQQNMQNLSQRFRVTLLQCSTADKPLEVLI